MTKIICSVTKGIHKEVCDDSALLGSEVINNDRAISEIDAPFALCAADGVGGNAGGRDASKFLLSYIKDNIDSFYDNLKDSLITANKSLIEYSFSQKGKERMATTFTGLFFMQNKTIIAHCGNTRAYILQGSYLKQITKDHTTYQWLYDLCRYEEAESCNKSEIRGAFGGGNENLLKTLEVSEVFKDGIPSVIILTSDGVHDYLDIDEMEDIITSDISWEEKTDELTKKAVQKGSEDDITVIIAVNK